MHKKRQKDYKNN